MANLPEWLDALIPQLTLPVKLKYADGKYYAHYPEGQDYPESGLSEPFNNFEEAYESVETESGYAVVFDDTLPEMKDLLFDGLIAIDEEGGGGRLFISSTEADSLGLLEASYSSWINFAENEYLNHTDDFLCSYYFVDRHPCFWVRDAIQNESPGWHDNWRVSEHTKRLDHSAGFSEDSPTRVSFNIEAGSHIAPEYTNHYHDLRLEVNGDSYEDAIIKLAEKIHKFYNLDGTKRSNVRYEKSPLEKLLIERLASSRARQSDSDNNTPDTNK